MLTVSCVLISWESIREREAEFYACAAGARDRAVGVFCAFDLMLFYVFFEFTLIPLFFMIGIWGGPQRRYAAVKFFLYTLAGSLVTLVGLVALVLLVAGDGLHDALLAAGSGRVARGESAQSARRRSRCSWRSRPASW